MATSWFTPLKIPILLFINTLMVKWELCLGGSYKRGDSSIQFPCMPGGSDSWTDQYCALQMRRAKSMNPGAEVCNDLIIGFNCCKMCYKLATPPMFPCEDTRDASIETCNNLLNLVKQSEGYYFYAMEFCLKTLFCSENPPYPFNLEPPTDLIPSNTTILPTTSSSILTTILSTTTSTPSTTTSTPSTTTPTTPSTTSIPQTTTTPEPTMDEVELNPEEIEAPIIPKYLIPVEGTQKINEKKEKLQSEYLPGNNNEWFPIRFGRRGI